MVSLSLPRRHCRDARVSSVRPNPIDHVAPVVIGILTGRTGRAGSLPGARARIEEALQVRARGTGSWRKDRKDKVRQFYAVAAASVAFTGGETLACVELTGEQPILYFSARKLYLVPVLSLAPARGEPGSTVEG